jgi:hypothetical protein
MRHTIVSCISNIVPMAIGCFVWVNIDFGILIDKAVVLYQGVFYIKY